MCGCDCIVKVCVGVAALIDSITMCMCVSVCGWMGVSVIVSECMGVILWV